MDIYPGKNTVEYQRKKHRKREEKISKRKGKKYADLSKESSGYSKQPQRKEEREFRGINIYLIIF